MVSWKSCVSRTTNCPDDVPVPADVVTAIGPVWAPVGTAAVSDDVLTTVTFVAAAPPNVTD